MVSYTMYEMPDMNDSGRRVIYPRVGRILPMDHEMLVNMMSANGMMAKSSVEGVLKCLPAVMARFMSLGYSIKVDGLGVFTPSLSLVEGKERETGDNGDGRRNAQSVRFAKVNFRTDKNLVAEINKKANLIRSLDKPVRSNTRLSTDERLELALGYLRENPMLTVAGYCRLTGLRHTTAANELKGWAMNPCVKMESRGLGSHKYYILKE